VVAQTSAAPAMAFGIGVDERPRKGGGVLAALLKKEGEKRGAAAIGQRHFKWAVMDVGDDRRRGTMRWARKGGPRPTAAARVRHRPWKGGHGRAAHDTAMPCGRREVGEPDGCQVGPLQ
jgi:hypothetical protein